MNYDSFASTFSNSRKNLPWPELDSIIDDMRKTGSQSILDVGCGNGRFLTEVQSSKFKVQSYLGVDNSVGMIEEARKLHPDYHFEVCPMESLGSYDPMTPGISQSTNLRTYDSLLFLASFHHLETREERLETLRQAKSLLNEGGKIYMTNWNLLSQEKYKDSHRGNGDFDIKIGAYSRYYHGFTLDELEGLFSETGFTIKENRVFEGGRNIISVLSI